MKKERPSIFKRFHVMNGWRDAPHCWWRFLLLPFRWEVVKAPPGRAGGWISVSFFGFVVFWMR
jgi:hypothetical protein